MKKTIPKLLTLVCLLAAVCLTVVLVTLGKMAQAAAQRLSLIHI